MLLRALGRRLGARLGRRRLEQIETLVRQGHTGQGLDLGSGRRAELAFGRLRLFRVLGHPEAQVPLEGSTGSLRLGRWVLEWSAGLAPERVARVGATTWVLGRRLSVRAWRPGDRIRPLGGVGSRLVVRCMQDEGIPRGDRPNWPVLLDDDQLIWVPDVCRSDARVPVAGSPATRIDARRA